MTPQEFDDHDPLADEGFEEIEQRMNINRLKNQAQNLAGGAMSAMESEELPPDIAERFWENVVAFERAPLVSLLQKLGAAGIEVPPDTELSDAEIGAKLTEITDFLATIQTFVETTDHLSDRELYRHLREESLGEAYADMPPEMGMRLHLDLLGTGSEEDTYLLFRYYWDDEMRASWMKQFPDYEMPERIQAPFDRDRFLPKAHYPHLDAEWEAEEENQS